MSFSQSHMRSSGLPHPKQLLFFCWYSVTTLAKQMIYSIGWSVPPTLPDTSTSSSAKGYVSPSPSCFTLESSSTSLSPKVTAWAVKVQLPFSLHKGSENMSCSIHWLQLSLGVEVPWSLPFFPAFIWLGAGQSSQLGFCHLLYEPTFTCIWGLGPHRSNHASSQHSLAGSFLGTLTGVSGPAATDAPHIQPHSPLIPA